MYSQQTVDRDIARISDALHVSLTRYDVDDVLQRRDDLVKLVNDDGSFKRPLNTDERAFIRNEQLLTTVDFRYWLERYATLIQDQGGLHTGVAPWESQLILLQVIARLEDEMAERVLRGEPVDGILIFLHKARQLGACLVAGTRVLTADLCWEPIERIRVGDALVAFDEHPPGGKGIARKMRRATVTNTCEFFVPTHRVKLDDGTEFVGTPHHRFLAKQRGSHMCQWRQLRDIRVGDELRRVVSPWNPVLGYDEGWIAGFFDGEGSLRFKKSGGAELCGAQVAGAVLDRAVRYLRMNHYDHRFDTDRRKGGEKSKFGDKTVYKVVVSRLHDIFRLVGTTRSSRFLERTWWEGKELPNCGGQTWAKVTHSDVSIERAVYDLQTTTGTYVAEGFASHNTAVGRAISVHAMLSRKHLRVMAASIDDDKVLELYDRDKLIIDNLPFYLKPSIGFDEKAQHIFLDKVGSRVIYQLGTQKSGLGQGRQFDVSHLTECASWPYPGIIEHDWMPTIPQSSRAFALLESTAQGRGNWWHAQVKRLQHHQLRRWRLVFIPWYAELKKYRAHPPTDWKPTDESMAHAQRVYETSERYVGRQVMLTREQLYWWESTREEYYTANNLAMFYTNYCATIEESFQHREKGLIGFDTLEYYRQRVGEAIPYRFDTVKVA